MKNFKKIRNWKIPIVIAILIILVAASAAHASIALKTEKKTLIHSLNPQPSQSGGSPVWDDDFKDTSKIDVVLSKNYTVDTSGDGTVFMSDTYEFWTNASRIRMQPIDIINSGGQTFTDYVIDMTIPYDDDMQSDFDDLRFANGYGNDLFYWIGSRDNGISADVLVKIAGDISPYQTITIYMFYGDPNAEDESNFNEVFTWEDKTDPDKKISFKTPQGIYAEGAWDSDVAFGDGRFLVAWEERAGPEDIGGDLHLERIKLCVIHGRSCDSDGDDFQPSVGSNLDIDISDPGSSDYHAENPSIAYSEDSDKFFVAWEQNPANLNQRFEADIKGAMVRYNGGSGSGAHTVTSRFTICSATLGQFDPCVAYDTSSDRFFVVWEDARSGWNNYNIYGSVYSSTGSLINGNIQITSTSYYQGQPWICSDNNGNFLVVYEDGPDGDDGPFSLKAKRYDSSGNQIGSQISIAQGSSNTDYVFPSCAYCPTTQRYFVAWTQADWSSSVWFGDVWGKILNNDGTTYKDKYRIKTGSFQCADVKPYLNTLFFVAYNDQGANSNIWGQIVSSDGTILTDEHQISDVAASDADWNNLAVGDGNIMSVWEDERGTDDYANAYGTVLEVHGSPDSPDIFYSFGNEVEKITYAQVVSTKIIPNDLVEWETFDAIYVVPYGNLFFDVLNESGQQILIENISPGGSLSSITDNIIRLRARFSRPVPEDTPVLDWWSVTWHGGDMEPPWTEAEFDPETPNGDNDWYISDVEVTLLAYDNDSEEIYTYYKINNGPQQDYDDPFILSEERSDNSIEFWSVDGIGNEELPHNIIEGISIDKTAPIVDIVSPSGYIIGQGDVNVSGYVGEFCSGINRVEIYLNDGKVPDDQVYLSEDKDYFEWHFNAEFLQIYTIRVDAYDNAGLKGSDTVNCWCSQNSHFQVTQSQNVNLHVATRENVENTMASGTTSNSNQNRLMRPSMILRTIVKRYSNILGKT
jgi:hypothetical protein